MSRNFNSDNTLKMRNTIYLIFFALLTLSSCVTHKNLLEIQNGTTKIDTLQTNREEYLLQPGDILDIRVSSPDPQSVAIFNKTVGQNTINQVTEPSVYLNGYIVSDSGTIDLPILGKIPVKGLPIREAKRRIQEQMSPYYKFYLVDVKLMNFRITILGEVNRPGTFYVYSDRSNIFQLIGEAGGITDLGNRTKVRIVRKKEDKSEVAYVDVTSAEVITSEFYYLQPNDVIYVEPLKAKPFRVNATATQILLSSLTFIVVVLNFLKL